MDSSFNHRYLWEKQGQIFVGRKRISVNFVVIFWRNQIFWLFLHTDIKNKYILTHKNNL